MSGNKILLSTNEVCKRLGISRNTLWRMERLGQVPAAIHIGSLKRWRSEDFAEVGIDIYSVQPASDLSDLEPEAARSSGRTTINLRYPQGMRAALAVAARMNGVSANAETSRRILIAPSGSVAGPLDVQKGDDQVLLRISQFDREIVEAAGREAQRSLTSEIVRRLASSLDVDGIKWRSSSVNPTHDGPDISNTSTRRFTSKRGDGQFRLRLPADALRLLKDAAFENRRSMNAELLDRLSASFEDRPVDDLGGTRRSIDARLTEIERHLRHLRGDA